MIARTYTCEHLAAHDHVLAVALLTTAQASSAVLWSHDQQDKPWLPCIIDIARTMLARDAEEMRVEYGDREVMRIFRDGSHILAVVLFPQESLRKNLPRMAREIMKRQRSKERLHAELGMVAA